MVVKSGQNFNPINFYWSCIISPLALPINQAKEEYPDLICRTSTQHPLNSHTMGKEKGRKDFLQKGMGKHPVFALNYNKRTLFSKKELKGIIYLNGLIIWGWTNQNILI